MDLEEKHAWLGNYFSRSQYNEHHKELETQTLKKSLGFYTKKGFA
jgi:hypothetical protein